MSVLYPIAPFFLTFVIAFGIGLLLVPCARYLSFRFNILSHPGGRRQERDPMPKLGGIVLYFSFTAAVILAQYLPIERQDPYEIVRLVGLLLGSSLIFVVGILDDIFELNFFFQALGQIASAGIAITFQIFIEYFNNPFTGVATIRWDYVVTVTLTLFWLGLMMNTVNFLDGSDGLAVGVALIAGLMLFLNSLFFVSPAQASVSILPLALMGSCLAFLLYNFYPARLYMGGGALYLGYLLGTISIVGGAKMATILMVMGLPLMDLAWQAFNRIRQRRNPFSGDRGHIHFRLLDSKLMTPKQLALGYYAFCAFFGFLTLVLESQLYKFITLGMMFAIIAVAFAMVTYVQRQATDKSESSYSSSSSE